LLWGQPSNTRRAAQAALVKAGLAEAGFDVDITPTQGWSAFTTDSKFDAAFHAWGKGSLLQAGIYSEFKSSVSDWGFSNARFDEIVGELEVGNFTDAQKLSRYIELDSLMADAATHLPIFQWPGLTVYNSDLKNVSPAPLVPNALWNFWEWKY
jgi:peptide/nickel transport system substrate-binding protein